MVQLKICQTLGLDWVRTEASTGLVCRRGFLGQCRKLIYADFSKLGGGGLGGMGDIPDMGADDEDVSIPRCILPSVVVVVPADKFSGG